MYNSLTRRHYQNRERIKDLTHLRVVSPTLMRSALVAKTSHDVM